MCDTWLARLLTGDQSIESTPAHGLQCGLSAGKPPPAWWICSSARGVDGLFLRLAITSVDLLACAYAAVLAEAKRYQAAELLGATDPRHPFDAELVSCVRGVRTSAPNAGLTFLRSSPRGNAVASPGS